MKNYRNAILLFILLAVIACGKESKKEAAMQPVDNIIAVAKSVESLNNALIEPEKALFDEFLMEELSYGHSGGKVQTKEAFIDDLINGSFDFQEIKISDEIIEIIGQTAVVRHILSAKANNAGTPVEIRMGILLVYQNNNGHWKLLARQAFKF